MEQSVVLIKPDGVARGIVGEVITRFEKVGLQMKAMKLIKVSATHVGKHYRDDKDYHRSVGKKTLENYQKFGLDANEDLGTKDPVEIGRIVRKRNMEFLSSGPVVAMLWEGNEVIRLIRKIVGHTFPAEAIPGTIRGDYGQDTAKVVNVEKRSANNIIHASGDAAEAEWERKLWFKEAEILS